MIKIVFYVVIVFLGHGEIVQPFEDREGIFHKLSQYPLVMSKLLKMAIEIVDLPINHGDFP